MQATIVKIPDAEVLKIMQMAERLGVSFERFVSSCCCIGFSAVENSAELQKQISDHYNPQGRN